MGAVGHPFGSEQVGRSQRASRVALVASRPMWDFVPHRSRGHILSLLSLGRATFSSRNRSSTSDFFCFPSSSTGCHDVSAVKSMHHGGARTSNLPLNSLAKSINIDIGGQTQILTPYVALSLNESAPTARLEPAPQGLWAP